MSTSFSSASTLLPTPQPGDAVAWVARHLGDLIGGDGVARASTRFRGGQSAADTALATLDLAGYAEQRNEVWPVARRGASMLSPYIRHGLIHLPRAWEAAASAPPGDRQRFRDELMWQEYARHVYARLGPAMADDLRFIAATATSTAASDVTATSSLAGAATPRVEQGWDRSMACMRMAMEELDDGWVPNQVRMWLASHWTVRSGLPWREGEEEFFTRLLDGSRAANRLGWQWTVGSGTGRPYGFSRHQVERRAPGICARCPLSRACPIEEWPPDHVARPVHPQHPSLRRDPDVDATAGPRDVHEAGKPEVAWITAESLGDDDPALAANPTLPAVFVFDLGLLRRLSLHGPRMVFLVECLGDLASRRDLRVHLGDPIDVLHRAAVATTFAPVPGWRSRSARIAPVQVHPWPWLVRPGSGPVTSFSAWRKGLGADGGARGRK
jgi:deoxyribodipyrimidine photo-lyase